MNSNNTTNISQACAAAAPFLAACAWIVFSVGIISNSVLIYFVLRKLAEGRRNDKVLLLNIVVSNFLSLCGSLPGEALGRGHTVPQLQKHCNLFTHTLFIALFTNLTSMSAICYDRYECVVKFPGQRRLSFRKTTYIIAAGWVLSLTLVPAVMSGFFVAESQGYYICETHSDKPRSSSATVSFFAVIVLVTVWITVTSFVIKYSLFAIYSKLKKHRKEVEQVLGIAKTVKEINLKKQTLAMIISYCVCFIPFGVAAGLTAMDIIAFHSCVFFACEVGSYASTATTALVYFTMDKRFRFKCKTKKIAKNKFDRHSRISP